MPEAYMKRVACQIAAQLPDSQQEALDVLSYVREIVMNLGGGWGRQSVPPTRLFVIDPTGREEAPATGKAAPSGPLDKANPG